LPAATTVVMPAATMLPIAVSSAAVAGASRLMFATESGALFAITYSMPAIQLETGPFPVQSRTRIGTIVAFFATPYSPPAIVADTCVP
jgi:hypothetical protein